MPQLTLHQFPLSHYCEKIRWVLDYKGLRYDLNNQFPGAHALVNRRLVGRTTVPLLVDGHHAIGESSAIALYLDDQFPDRRLIPVSGEERNRVLALEGFFDQQAGPAVRRYVYGFVLRRPSLFSKVFFTGYGRMLQALGHVTSSFIAKQIAKMYKVGGDSASESLALIDASFARLEELIEDDPDAYLVGSQLTLADITAATLLGPLIAPSGSPWTMEIDVPEVLALREKLRARPGGRWVLARYERDRRPPVSVTNGQSD